MPRAYLLTGSNIGDRATYLSDAAKGIEMRGGNVMALSPIYETEAWGNTNQQPYLNQVMAIDTILSATALMDALLDTEHCMGRVRDNAKWAPRTIDIDILLYDNLQIDTLTLKIPHPLLPQRRFAIVPLFDLAPTAIYVRTGQTIAELLKQCTDTLEVKHWLRVI